MKISVFMDGYEMSIVVKDPGQIPLVLKADGFKTVLMPPGKEELGDK